MGIKLWEIKFGWHTDERIVEAKDISEALEKALKYIERLNLTKEEKNDYWISKIGLIAESDE